MISPHIKNKQKPNTTHTENTYFSQLKSATLLAFLHIIHLEEAPKVTVAVGGFEKDEHQVSSRGERSDQNQCDLDLTHIYNNEDSFEGQDPVLNRTEGDRQVRVCGTDHAHHRNHAHSLLTPEGKPPAGERGQCLSFFCSLYISE